MEEFPITFAQRFIYEVMQKLGPNASSLHVITLVRINGPIDIERFRLAADALAHRLPILRAVLEVKRGNLVQRLGTIGPSVEVIDKPAADDSLASSIISPRADDPIDIFSSSPLRIVILTTAPDEAILLFVGHHMFMDATALHRVLEEFLTIYADIDKNGGQVTGSSGYPDFFDYAMQEHELLLDGTYDNRSQFWLRELENGDPELHLNGRHRDPEMASSAFMSVGFEEELFTAVRNRAAAIGVSVFAVLASSVLYTLWDFVTQDSLALSVVSDTRMPPFHRTLGQFADIFVICESRADRGLDADAIRLLGGKLLDALVNRVPLSYFRENVPWLAERASRGNTMSDVYINYHPKVLRARGLSNLAGCAVAPFRLRDRNIDANMPFYGKVIGFNFSPGARGEAPLLGSIQYDSGVIKEDVARAIRDAWLDNLNRLAFQEGQSP
jgi:hypothetical protein